ncbi:hypothetical protein COLO4_22312 [Corchorus olitorius]|uniref:Uncharacterized protein n=1 Tax=Corchorus olitorius TaxID=93759 RepID=A0A1R3IMZ6_9ROSI|nr:hypothetical protein COLO4_22312 [Corchorus olitorius]
MRYLKDLKRTIGIAWRMSRKQLEDFGVKVWGGEEYSFSS